MPRYQEMPQEALKEVLRQNQNLFEAFKQQGLKLDMSRGKPGADQLDVSARLHELVGEVNGYKSEDGTDCRNYGLPDGLPEMKRLFGAMLKVNPNRVIVGGNSSLNMMFDTFSYYYTHGVMGSQPWCKLPVVKFLCPSPGYDRHFAICEFFGVEMIPVAMKSDGPDIDEIQKLIANDESVKGMWCVPKYSNPDGITYSDAAVRSLAALKPAAKDFRIFWDDAYCIHHLYDKGDELLSMTDACEQAGNEDMVIEFASTSKVTYPGAGVAALAASAANIAYLKKRITIQTIGPDKINQLRHARMFGDLEGLAAHMKKHAEILRPKFELVLSALKEELTETGAAEWQKPNGGYFVSVNVLPGTAKRVVALCAEGGVVLTPAGATYPYGKDPSDRNIRIAPTFPPLPELKKAMELFCIAVRLAAAEKLLGQF